MYPAFVSTLATSLADGDLSAAADSAAEYPPSRSSFTVKSAATASAAEKPAHVAPGMQPSVPEGLCTPLSIPWLTKTAELLFLQGHGEPVASGRAGS